MTWPVDADRAHVHAGGRMRFDLVDGHPWVVETCDRCGTIRRYRAFERTWDPGASEHAAGDADAARDADPASPAVPDPMPDRAGLG